MSKKFPFHLNKTFISVNCESTYLYSQIFLSYWHILMIHEHINKVKILKITLHNKKATRS